MVIFIMKVNLKTINFMVKVSYILSTVISMKVILLMDALKEWERSNGKEDSLMRVLLKRT